MESDTSFVARLVVEKLELERFQHNKPCFPTTMHVIRGIFGVKELYQLRYHICTCLEHYWQPLPEKEWRCPPLDPTDPAEAEGPDFVCECGAHRFRLRKHKHGKEVPIPQMVRACAHLCGAVVPSLLPWCCQSNEHPCSPPATKCKSLLLLLPLQECFYFGVTEAFLMPNFSIPAFVDMVSGAELNVGKADCIVQRTPRCTCMRASTPVKCKHAHHMRCPTGGQRQGLLHPRFILGIARVC